MPTFQERLAEALELRGMTPADLARATQIGEGAISQYKRGAYKASQRNLEKISKALHISIPWLMGVSDNASKDSVFSLENVLPLPKMKMVPLIGTIACGNPILAIEDAEETVAMPEHINADFALHCKGDSMINARIFDGDIVYIRTQPEVENGQIAAVRVGDDATLKRVMLYADHISLEPENPQYRPIVLWGEDMNTVQILGKAVYFTSAVR